MTVIAASREISPPHTPVNHEISQVGDAFPPRDALHFPAEIESHSAAEHQETGVEHVEAPNQGAAVEHGVTRRPRRPVHYADGDGEQRCLHGTHLVELDVDRPQEDGDSNHGEDDEPNEPAVVAAGDAVHQEEAVVVHFDKATLAELAVLDPLRGVRELAGGAVKAAVDLDGVLLNGFLSHNVRKRPIALFGAAVPRFDAASVPKQKGDVDDDVDWAEHHRHLRDPRVAHEGEHFEVEADERMQKAGRIGPSEDGVRLAGEVTDTVRLGPDKGQYPEGRDREDQDLPFGKQEFRG